MSSTTMKKTPIQPTQQKQKQEEGLIELQALIDRAKAGDRTTLPRLREYLDLNPDLWQQHGNVGSLAQAVWIRLIAGSDLYRYEVIVRRVNAMRKLYTSETPVPMEALLVNRIIMAWLQLAYIEACEAQRPETNIRWAEFQLKRQAQAEKQLRVAIDALTNLRKAQKTITVEVRQEAPILTTRSIMPEAYNEAPTYTGPVNRIKNLV